MSAKRQKADNRQHKRPQQAGPPPARQRAAALKLRRVGSSNEYELIPCRCARERADDLEEVCDMIDEGEIDVALDELRWLLAECPEFLDAHQLLGELALADGDVPLARGHFGYAYDLGLAALPSAEFGGTLPFALPANRGFLTAGKGLVHCLRERGQAERAGEVAARLLAFDPSDPLGIRTMLAASPPAPPAPAADRDGAP